MMPRVLTVLLLVGLIACQVGMGTGAYLIDNEQNLGNTFTAAVDFTPPIILLDDGFEAVVWDENWDDNGVTQWNKVVSTPVHSGSRATQCKKNAAGPITTNDLDASGATTSISISFWFRPTGLEPGDILVQLYNGGTYNTWYDITNYSTYAVDQWCYFNEVILGPQYFHSNFRLRFDGSAVAEPDDLFVLDDVLIVREWE